MAEAFALIGRGHLSTWEIRIPPREPSPTLVEVLKRLNSFMVTASEAGNELLIDALLAEIVLLYPSLRVWKSETLDTDTLTGLADYLIVPYLDYLSTPLMCVVEAKRDDFVMGEIQCLGEMHACRRKNEAAGLRTGVHGIVSNGQAWVFYRWTADDSEFGRTALFGIHALRQLLSALDYVCATCDAQLAAAQHTWASSR